MNSIKWLGAAFVLAFAVSFASAQNQSFDDVVKKVEAKLEPAAARRGQAVAWKLTIELIDGWHTYPTRQADPDADSYVNKIKFPAGLDAVFVGYLKEPKGTTRNESGVKINMIEGSGTWERTLLIRPDAKPGKLKIKVPVRIMACADRCLPPQTVNVEAEITISDAPAVAVDPKYQKDLEKK
jgi:DsbC/DsbD-like thiol-disulfide interchange protein